ncbi:hypothetical protein KM043_013535 [Ampulex compressa]|nr:hypothetical protein KM043_013535 [Ampulex compressa]
MISSAWNAALTRVPTDASPRRPRGTVPNLPLASLGAAVDRASVLFSSSGLAICAALFGDGGSRRGRHRGCVNAYKEQCGKNFVAGKAGGLRLSMSEILVSHLELERGVLRETSVPLRISNETAQFFKIAERLGDLRKIVRENRDSDETFFLSLARKDFGEGRLILRCAVRQIPI